jgi:AraC-like DNA-binding protein
MTALTGTTVHGGRGDAGPAVWGRDCYFVTGRTPAPRTVHADGHVLLAWSPSVAGLRLAGGRRCEVRAGEYALTAGDESVALEPGAHGRDSKIHVLGTTRAALADIAAELQAVSKSRIDLDRLLEEIRARPLVARQPAWLGALLADLGQAASLGLCDPAWERRYLRLVWERLIFSRAVLARPDGPVRPRPSPTPRRLGLDQRLRRVRRLLESDYQRPLDLAEMAALACVSRFHFLREFRKAFGRTPYQLLLDIRLREACRLLQTGALPIQEISRKVGFASSDGFYRAFRRRYGRPPSEYPRLD